MIGSKKKRTMDWHYEKDWERNPTTKKLETIYRKFQLRYTGNIVDIPQTATDDGSDILGGYSVEETEKCNVKRISEEEYENLIAWAEGDNDEK